MTLTATYVSIYTLLIVFADAPKDLLAQRRRFYYINLTQMHVFVSGYSFLNINVYLLFIDKYLLYLRYNFKFYNYVEQKQHCI